MSFSHNKFVLPEIIRWNPNAFSINKITNQISDFRTALESVQVRAFKIHYLFPLNFFVNEISELFSKLKIEKLESNPTYKYKLPFDYKVET